MRFPTNNLLAACAVVCFAALFPVPAARCATLASLLEFGQRLNVYGSSDATISELANDFSMLGFELEGDPAVAPSSIYPDNVASKDRNLAAMAAELALNGEEVRNVSQDWYCYDGEITLGAHSPHVPPLDNGGKWWAAVLIGGTGKFYQGKALFFPQGSLPQHEADAILETLRVQLPESRTRTTADGLTITELVTTHPSHMETIFNERTVACYVKPLKGGMCELVFVFLSDYREAEE